MDQDQEDNVQHDDELEEEFEVMHEEQQRQTRGPTERKTEKNPPWTPQFNENGQPIGENFLDFSLQLGVITRTKVPITHETWKQVDKKVKDQVWLEVKAYYKIQDDNAKKQVLVQAGGMWKAFKSRLRKEFMDHGKSPFGVYKFIEPKAWNDFLTQENTDEKKARREKGRLDAQEKKFPPRLGPTGYHGNDEVWDKEGEDENIATPAHCWDPRTRSYMLARMPKDKNGKRHIPPEMEDVVDELASYNEKLVEGSWKPPPGEDVLTQVLGKEHGGRTLAVGSHVGFTKGLPGYIKKPRKNRQKEEIEFLKKIVEEKNKQMEMEIEERCKQREMEIEKRYKQREEEIRASCMKMVEDRLASVPLKMPVREGSPSVRSSTSASNFKEPCIVPSTVVSSIAQGPQRCVLYVPPTNIKCATGMVHPVGNRILHGRLMEESCVKVQVDSVDPNYKDFDLPFPPEPDMVKLGQARSSYIQWPKSSVGVAKPKAGKKISPPTRQLDCSTSKATQKGNVAFGALPGTLAKRPNYMQTFYKGVKERNNPVMVKVNIDVFFTQEPFSYGIQHDDILLLVDNGWLDCGIIAFFAMCLHNQLMTRQKSQGRPNQCFFLNPYMIQDQALTSDTGNVYKYLCKAVNPFFFNKQNYLILPYLQQRHWSLMILAPGKGLGFILDPLNKDKKKTHLSYNLTHIIIECLGNRFDWTVVDCNQQDKFWECGFYVMRWMYEFVISQPHELSTKIPWTSTLPYTQMDIDKIVGQRIGHFADMYG